MSTERAPEAPETDMKNSPEATLKPSSKLPIDEQLFSMFSERAMEQIGAPMLSSPPVNGAKIFMFSEIPKKDTWLTRYKPKDYKPTFESPIPKLGQGSSFTRRPLTKEMLPNDPMKIFDAEGRALRPILERGEMLQYKQVKNKTRWCPHCPHCYKKMKKLL
ncbi:unnamed protein product [Ceutorhynchus assimilis]|uniref:Uncharacterized protein n=1 Tax=Ceutorhynchus assimilis TaxID=467358 RepID=A0A9N9ME93_9CUCU|nr:unnamed protein product [Ceutorhynchus assimilis]